MKNIIFKICKISVTALILFSSAQKSYAGSSSYRQIYSWDDSIPVSSKVILAELKAEAAYLSYETDDGACGGTVTNPELIDAQEEVTADGSIVHNLKIRFEVTKAVNYCAQEEAMTCEVPFTVLGQSDVVMGHWACE